jgi:hypothetical protein
MTTDTYKPTAGAGPNSARYTQLPWRSGHTFDNGGDWATAIYRDDSGGAQVGLLSASGAYSETEATANAAFIVTACNSHAALVAALRSIIAAYPPKNYRSKGRSLAPALEMQARAALALAEGSQQ